MPPAVDQRLQPVAEARERIADEVPTWEVAMTMKDKLEVAVFGAILMIGLPALMFAVQGLAS